MMLQLSRLLVVPLLLVIALPVRAQPEEQPLLKKEHVRGFLDSMDRLQELSDDHGQKFDDMSERETEDFADLYSALMAEFQGQDLLNEATAIVNRHGFENLEVWAATGTRMFQAFFALKYEETAPERKAALDEALKRIEESAMDETQKEEMRKAMGMTGAGMQPFSDVSEEEKKAVAPFMERIDKMGEEEDSE